MKNNQLLHFYIFAFLFLFLSNQTFSQAISTYTPKINIPSSPEAALLGRFGDIPIGYYTGTAEIAVPLYSIKEEGLEIPITLSYHSSGIKVADEATWVGLGWDLSPEGTISVEVRGETDLDHNQRYSCEGEPSTTEFKNRFIYPGDYYSLLEIGRTVASPPCLEDGGNAYKDSYCVMTDLLAGKRQPDIFSYNFNGYSGKFYINPDTYQIVMLDNKSEDISFEVGSGGVRAKTLDGKIFEFYMLEDSHVAADSAISGYTFKLSRIVLPNGKVISYTYITEPMISYYYTESIDFIGPSLTGPGSVPPGTVAKHSSFTTSNKKTLTKIESSTATIVFNLEDRDDIASPNSTKIKRLKSIDVFSVPNNTKIKSYNFNYTYFGNNTDGINSNNNSGELNKRLKLDSVKEIGYESNGTADTSKPSYLFNYKTDILLPQKNSFAVDIWGYYNGQYNTTYIPNLDYFHYDLASVFSTMLNGVVQKPYFKFAYNTANRYTDNYFAGTNMLTKITYPTGGYSQFEYEPNSFSNQFIPEVYKNAMAYKNNYILDNNDSGNTLIKTFKLSKEVTIDFTNVISGYNVNRAPWTYQEMIGAYIEFSKIKTINGTPTTTVIKKWELASVYNVDYTNNNSTKQWNETLLVPYDADASVSYIVTAYMPDNLNYADNFYHSSNVNSRFKYYDDIYVDTSISNQCGMRIKSIKNYSKFGIITSNKQIKYYGGKLLNKFEPITMLHYNAKSSGGVTGGNSYEYIAFAKKISLASDDFGTNGGNPIGYDKVEEIEIVDTELNNNGKKTFYYNNIPNKSKTGLPNIPNLTNGLISKEENYNKTGTLLSDKTYFYSTIGPNPVFIGIKPVLKSFGSYGVPCGNDYDPTPPLINAYYNDNILSGVQYKFEVYPLNSARYMLYSTNSNEYFNGKTITNKESYTYNSQGKIRTITNWDSNNDQLSATYLYANDYPTLDNIEQIMVDAKMTGIPLVTEKRKNTELLSRSNLGYAKDVTTNNLILPKYIFFGKGSNGTTFASSEKKVTFNQYDSKGNIQQYTMENGSSVIILWGYGKTVPIAKIENATYEQIAAALGISTTALNAYDENNLTAINGLRNNAALSNSQIMTYTYIPSVGVSTITDAKDDKITYTYDSFGRLQFVKDKNNNILSQNNYQYQN